MFVIQSWLWKSLITRPTNLEFKIGSPALLVQTLRIILKAHAGLQGGDRNICNMLLSSDLPLALVLCTNSKKPI